MTLMNEIKKSRLDAETRAASLRDEQAAKVGELDALKRSLVADSSCDLSATRGKIAAAECRIKDIDILIAHSEADRFRALIAEAKHPIEGYERDLAVAFEEEEQAGQALKLAQEVFDQAQRRVAKINHDIADSRRKVEQHEIHLSNHLAESRKALAA